MATLATGAKLGPYEIIGAIGAGGMGEVYRAHDTKFARDVEEVKQKVPTGEKVISMDAGTRPGQ